MDELTDKQKRILEYTRKGWARWLPLLGIDLLIAVVDVEQFGGDIAACRTMNAFFFRRDVLSQLLAYFVEEDEVARTGHPESVQRLRERRRLGAILTELVGVAPLRTLGDLLDLLCRLRILQVVSVGGHTSWRVSDPLPSVLDFDIPRGLREQELQIQSQYALRDHLDDRRRKTSS